jgi:hypothetical protein
MENCQWLIPYDSDVIDESKSYHFGAIVRGGCIRRPRRRQNTRVMHECKNEPQSASVEPFWKVNRSIGAADTAKPSAEATKPSADTAKPSSETAKPRPDYGDSTFSSPMYIAPPLRGLPPHRHAHTIPYSVFPRRIFAAHNVGVSQVHSACGALHCAIFNASEARREE